MTTIGSMGVYDGSGSLVYTFEFFHLLFPDGFAWDIFQQVVEPITARGVLGTRMRILRTDAPRFRMTGFTEYETWADAVTGAEAMKGYKGYLGQLAFSAGGTAFTFPDQCFIWDLMPKPAPVQLASTIASYNSTGMVATDFELQFTKL
jgi:hypothetical protein